MEHLTEWLILWIVAVISVGLLFYCLRKKLLAEWLLVFFLKACISPLIDNYLIQAHYIEYPVRFLSKWFDTSLVFDYLTFPMLCVLYNQTSYHSKLPGIFTQAIVYSGTLTYIEYWLERNTLVITYHNWSWVHTFIFFILIFLVGRGFLGLVRIISKQKKEAFL